MASDSRVGGSSPACTDDRTLDLERTARLDELAAHRADDCVRDGRLAPGTHASQVANGRPEEWVGGVPRDGTRPCRRRARAGSGLPPPRDRRTPAERVAHRHAAALPPTAPAAGAPSTLRCRPSVGASTGLSLGEPLRPSAQPTGPRGPDTYARCGSSMPSPSARASGSSGCSWTSFNPRRRRPCSTSGRTSSASARETAAGR